MKNHIYRIEASQLQLFHFDFVLIFTTYRRTEITDHSNLNIRLQLVDLNKGLNDQMRTVLSTEARKCFKKLDWNTKASSIASSGHGDTYFFRRQFNTQSWLADGDFFSKLN